MARTTQMSLIELMTLSEDISNVVEYLGRKGSFQFQSKKHDFSADKGVKSVSNFDRDFLDNLQKARIFLNIDDLDSQADTSRALLPRSIPVPAQNPVP